MSARTSETAVKALLGGHYDSNRLPSVQPFIDTAASLVDKVAAYDTANNSPVLLSTTDLEIIERWLSGHFYGQADQMLASRSTGKASGSFQGQTGMHLDNTIYGQQAQMLDTTGYLAALQKGGTIGGFWLGKPASAALSYRDRN